MGTEIFDTGVYEPTIIKIIRGYVEHGFSFVDIGANIGIHTLAAAFRRSSEAQKFIGFEPEPNCFSILTKNCLSNKLSFVTVIQEALGDEDQIMKMHVSSGSNRGNHSLLPRNNTTPQGEVKVSKIDSLDLSNRYNITTPVFIKIDVEGYEPRVIQGGMQWLRSLHDAALICEMSPNLLRMYGKSPADIITQLREAGFHEHYIIKDRDTIGVDNTLNSDYFNMLFIKGMVAKSLFDRLHLEECIVPDSMSEDIAGVRM
jgi:FkbM family methyltransferase